MKMQRYWVDRGNDWGSSKEHHGKNVLAQAMPFDGSLTLVYFTEGREVSDTVPSNSLRRGWIGECK
jgi:hypothetical protein